MRRAARTGLVLAAPLTALALGLGCAARSATRPVGRQLLETTIRSRGVTPTHVVVPYRLTGEMRTWLREHVTPGLIEPRERLTRLSRALFDKGGLGVEYVRGHTGTASEVFETRQANCLAFTNLFVGMARALDLPVYFLEVRNVESFRREGDLIVVSDHVAVGHGPLHEMTVIDFAEVEDAAVRRIQVIDDLRAIAMFYSNRGAERLRDGRHDEALDWLRSAVAIDPGYEASWVNLGVALRRSGHLEQAELAYRTALEIDIRSTSAVQNLAALLTQRGEFDEAMDLLAAADRGSNRNPFTYLTLGDLSMRHGKLDLAGDYYRKAIRRQGENAESFAAMGLWYLRSGELKKAAHWLHRAEVLDPQASRVSLLKQSLANSSGAS